MLWWSLIYAGGRARVGIIVSEDHQIMAVVAGDYSGLPGRVERWLRATTVALRTRADGPWRWGPADLRALFTKIMLEPEGFGVRLVEMTEPSSTTCNLELATAILQREVAQSSDPAQELKVA